MSNSTSLHMNAVDRLAGWIVSGRYGVVGALPNEEELGLELGVSRTVVREAIKTLAAKGMLASRPRSGTRVRQQEDWLSLDPQVLRWRMQNGATDRVIKDIVEFRFGLEPYAARLCAQKGFDARPLFAALQEMDRAIEGHGDYRTSDLRFHSLLLEGADNQFLRQLSPFIGGVLHLSFSLSESDDQRATFPQHEAVARAVADRKPEEAAKRMEELVRMAADNLSKKRAGTMLGGLSEQSLGFGVRRT